MSYRKDWVAAKAQAIKLNGGKDVWKVAKIKNQDLGPALDVWEAAEKKFDAVTKTFDGVGASRADVDKWAKAAKERLDAGHKVGTIMVQYINDLKRAAATPALSAEAHSLLLTKITGWSRKVNALPSVAELQQKVAHYRAKAS